MALIVKHEFVSAKGDGADATQVQPSNWNAAHTLSGSLATAQVDGLDVALATIVVSNSVSIMIAAQNAEWVTSASIATRIGTANAEWVTSNSISSRIVTATAEFLSSNSISIAIAEFVTSNSISTRTVTALADYDTSNSVSSKIVTALGEYLTSNSISVFVAAYAEPIDADILRADTTDQLVAGYTAANDDDGIYPDVTATYVADVATGNFKEITNGGAFTLKPPSPVNDEWAVVDVYIVNAADAGAITVTPFTKTTGDAFTTTDTHKFIARITVADIGGTEYSHLDVVALQ